MLYMCIYVYQYAVYVCLMYIAFENYAKITYMP